METLKKTFEKISKQENKNHCENIHTKKEKSTCCRNPLLLQNPTLFARKTPFFVQKKLIQKKKLGFFQKTKNLENTFC